MDKYSAPVEMGYKTHNAYETETQVIVCGDPGDNENHNCDEMGCTSVSHVLFRFDKDEIDRLTEENSTLIDKLYEVESEHRHHRDHFTRAECLAKELKETEELMSRMITKHARVVTERDMYKEGSDVLVTQLAAMIKARDDYRDRLVAEYKR